MKLRFKKVLAAFSKDGATEVPDADNYVEDIMKSIDKAPFAISDKNVLFANISELGGYFYVITITVGAFKIKTMKGAKLDLKSDDFNLVLNSDIDEFESDSSNVSKRYITRIDFQIEEEDVPKFDKKNIKTLTLTSKKQEVIFKTL